jgi:ribose transport system ATP-binding protein
MSSWKPDSTDPGPAARSSPRLEIRSASKTFAGTKVLDSVSLTVNRGEIHGLIGQNGSGKSTLIKLLSGFHAADRGTEMLVDGKRLRLPPQPRHLRELGLSFVHQDLGLVDDASVIDNVRVGQFTRRRWSRHINWPAERRAVLETFARLQVDLGLQQPVAGLTAAQRAVVAISRALQGLSHGHGCIVLDESTTALPKETLQEFHAILRDLAAQGTSVFLVSHRIDEIVALTDRVTVLRDGRLVAGGVPTGQTSAPELTRLMLGREADRSPLRNALPGTPASTALEAVGLRGSQVRRLNLTVRAGEVLGVTGHTESGFEELPYLLAGASPGAQGEVQVDGTSLSLRSHPVAAFLSAGIALVPARRADEGLALSLSLLENMSLPQIRGRSGRFRLTREWQWQDLRRMGGQLGITPLNPDAPAAILSGGNQQKLLLGKWLATSPRVLVMHEPTQGVDVGARRDILIAARRVAAGGAAVLIASMEVEDLATACDRVLVMADGQLADELTGDLDADAILSAIFAHTPHAERQP